jgi:Tfp pilus assembly protein PilF
MNQINPDDDRDISAALNRSGPADCGPAFRQSLLAQTTGILMKQQRWRKLRRWLGISVAAAILVGLGVLLGRVGSARMDAPRSPGPPPEVAGGADSTAPDQVPKDALKARPRPAGFPSTPIAVGTALNTGAGQQQRVTLLDGSVLYLNEHTAVKVDAERRVTLSSGEVFVEVAPAGSTSPFVIQAAQREISALGTKFAVRSSKDQGRVVVVQGQVKVSDQAAPLIAGQQLNFGQTEPLVAPRASHVLDWTRDLIAAAESPLVPATKFSGGALVAIDPQGQEAKLSLRNFHIDVHIEDGFARTIIDQTYFNHEPWRLEGTFFFPLPADASLSRLAMYVDGKLMEGGMTEREYARQVFDRIVSGQRDPALLEWVDGSTFKMRVFPLEGWQEKRIIIGYTQRLTSLYGQAQYRFPAGHSLGAVAAWSFHARVKNGAARGSSSWSSVSHDLKPSVAGGDLLLDAEGKNVRLDRDLVLKVATAGPQAPRFSSAVHEGSRYFVLRYRPHLEEPALNPATAGRNRKAWIFLFESAGDRNPLLARAQIEIIRAVLNNAEHDDTFAIVSAGTRSRTFPDPGGLTSPACLLPVTPANIQAGLDFLENSHLVGALDLGHAISACAPLIEAGSNAHVVHVGGGLAGIGERRAEILACMVPQTARYIGIGVGKRWSRSFMQAAADRTGGYTTQINPDEPIAWRTFDLLATLSTPRLLDIHVSESTGKAPCLSYANAISQGEEFCTITRFPADAALPLSVTVTGKVNGKDFKQVLNVGHVEEQADYLPRTWAKLEIDRLLADPGAKNKDRIVELSKAMYVMTPYTSLLVLENEEMYKQFKVDRGRKDHWAPYDCPEKLAAPGEPGVAPGSKPTPAEVLQTLLIRMPPAILKWPNQPDDERRPDHLTAFDYDNGNQSRAVDPPVGYPPSVTWNQLTERRKNLAPAAAMDAIVPGGFAGLPAAPRVTIQRGGGGGTPDVQEQVQDLLVDFPDVATLKKIRDYAQRLAQPVYLDRGIEPNTPLKDALELLTERYDLTLIVNTRAFEAIGVQKVEEQPVQLPKMMGVSMGTILRLLLSQIRGDVYTGGYLVRGDHIEVTTTYEMEMEKSRLYPVGDRWRILGRREQFTLLDTFLVFDKGFSPAGIRNEPALDWRYRPPGSEPSAVRSPVRSRLPASSLLQITQALRGSPIGWERLTALAPTATPSAAVDDPDEIAKQIRTGEAPYSDQSLVYARPQFSGDSRVFADLASYAPGMNTSRADILATLEAEAQLQPDSVIGRIDPAARRLIDQARAAGWQSATVSTSGSQPGGNSFTVVFNGQGRYRYDRILGEGLRERVVCDGKHVWHFYPELAIGAWRALSRFHRDEFAELIPWMLSPPEDLGRGADLESIDEQTVAVVPRAFLKTKAQLRMTFSPDGRLAERKLLDAAGKVLYRENYTAEGRVELLDAAGKTLSLQKLTVSAAPEPDLKPDTRAMFVLPLPLRTPEFVYRNHKIEEKTPFKDLSREAALELFSAYFGEQSTRVGWLKECFNERGRPALGYFTLLAATGCDVGPKGPAGNVLEVHPDAPLAKYLTAVRDPKLSQPVSLGDAALLQRLFHLRLLTSPHFKGATDEAIGTAIRQTRDGPHDYLAWAVLSTLHSRIGPASPHHRLLAETYPLFQETPALSYESRYEQARALLDSQRRTEARALLLESYEQGIAAGLSPLVDHAFRRALAEEWPAFARRTVGNLVAQKRRPEAVTFAWQCWQLGDRTLADPLLATALDGVGDDQVRLRTKLAAIEFLWHTYHLHQADQQLHELLEDARYSQRSSLWRLAGDLAARRGQPARSLACLERAVDLDMQRLPEALDLEAVRNDFRVLLAHYERLMTAWSTLEVSPQRPLAARIVRAADRWRALDPEEEMTACVHAARLLYRLQAVDLAWDYLNTPQAIFAADPFSWQMLAQVMSRQEDFVLADLAYSQAVAADPSDAAILWEQAQNLRRAGRNADSAKLLKRIAHESWDPQFKELQAQARWQLEGR